MILLGVAIIFGLLGFACGIASLVFFIQVVMQMFKREESKTLGIICVVLTLVAGGIGPIIAFIFGWTKAKEWDIKKLMTSWTLAIVIYAVSMVIAVGSGLAAVAIMAPEQNDFDMGTVPSVDIEFGTDFDDFGADAFPDVEAIPEQP